MRTALKEGHNDEMRYHLDVFHKRMKECRRLESMYVNKLVGKMGEYFYEQKSAEWREDQKDIHHRLEEHENSSQSDMEEGNALMD